MRHPLKDLLATGADDAPAISAPSRAPLTFGALRTLIADTLASLNGLGIGRNDRVAIVLPNGPEMATCYMACASGVASAPLNPAYRADEFEFYLSDLNAKALIVEQGSTSPAIEVATKLGVRLIDLLPTTAAGAGSFTLQPREAGGTATTAGGYAEVDDVSMVLHTSGTTSRPKIVPLSQGNLAASATHIRRTLQFVSTDCGRCAVVFDDQRLGVQVRQVELELVGAVGRVQRGRRHTAGGADEAGRHLGAVGQHEGDAVIAADAQAVQRG